MHDVGMFLFVALVTGLTPGAGVLFTVGNAFQFGIHNAWRSPLGNMMGVAFVSFLTAVGLGGVIAASDILFYGLQTFGALVLIYLGWRSWKAPAMNLMKLGKVYGNRNQGVNAKNVIWQAALLQTSNPMLFIFLLSLLPQFLTPSDPGYPIHISILITLFVIIVFFVHIFYSYTACLIGRKLHGDRFSWWLNHVSAGLFWFFAASVLWQIAEKFLL